MQKVELVFAVALVCIERSRRGELSEALAIEMIHNSLKNNLSLFPTNFVASGFKNTLNNVDHRADRVGVKLLNKTK